MRMLALQTLGNMRMSALETTHDGLSIPTRGVISIRSQGHSRLLSFALIMGFPLPYAITLHADYAWGI